MCVNLYIFFTMLCLRSFLVFFHYVCLFDLQLLFFNTFQKVVNGVG